ncbi:response regulator [Catalinimonas niigatensis]|uniref:response regulator n=1 Tax=Catalinimonas niigatensis TaxID=1397264 RepID=UPI002664E922|nr:response regulator [Catalinimonas niigatensis]WPP50876.1 response regulator [Catalinimonas niigatensis]
MGLPKKILLIDDDEINNFVAEEWVKQSGLEVRLMVMSDAFLALEYLKECAPHDFPDIILCDLSMPGYDGFDFLNQYETLYYLNNVQTQIIMMSATLLDKDQKRLKAFSCITAAMVKNTVQENFRMIKDNYLK